MLKIYRPPNETTKMEDTAILVKVSPRELLLLTMAASAAQSNADDFNDGFRVFHETEEEGNEEADESVITFDDVEHPAVTEDEFDDLQSRLRRLLKTVTK